MEVLFLNRIMSICCGSGCCWYRNSWDWDDTMGVSGSPVPVPMCTWKSKCMQEVAPGMGSEWVLLILL